MQMFYLTIEQKQLVNEKMNDINKYLKENSDRLLYDIGVNVKDVWLKYGKYCSTFSIGENKPSFPIVYMNYGNVNNVEILQTDVIEILINWKEIKEQIEIKLDKFDWLLKSIENLEI